jgi:hypothetical protein
MERREKNRKKKLLTHKACLEIPSISLNFSQKLRPFMTYAFLGPELLRNMFRHVDEGEHIGSIYRAAQTFCFLRRKMKKGILSFVLSFLDLGYKNFMDLICTLNFF